MKPCRVCGVAGCTGRDERGGWLPGHSANPGGQTKKLAKVKRELLRLGPKAIARLEAILDDKAEDTKVVIQAVALVVKHTVPVPKDVPDRDSKSAAGVPTLPRDVAARVAEAVRRLNS